MIDNNGPVMKRHTFYLDQCDHDSLEEIDGHLGLNYSQTIRDLVWDMVNHPERMADFQRNRTKITREDSGKMTLKALNLDPCTRKALNDLRYTWSIRSAGGILRELIRFYALQLKTRNLQFLADIAERKNP